MRAAIGDANLALVVGCDQGGLGENRQESRCKMSESHGWICSMNLSKPIRRWICTYLRSSLAGRGVTSSSASAISISLLLEPPEGSES